MAWDKCTRKIMKWIKIDTSDSKTFPKAFKDIIFTDGKNVYCGWRANDDEEDLEFMSATMPKTWPQSITHWMTLPEPPTKENDYEKKDER